MTINIPSSWSEITIDQYQRLYKVGLTEYEHGEIDREIATLSILTGLETDQLESLARSEIVKLSHATDFIKKSQPSDKLYSHFKVNGRKFLVTLEAQKINAQQFILLNKYTETEAGTIENLHNIIAVLTNEKKWYLRKSLPFEEDFEGKARLFKNYLSFEKANAISIFFSKVYQIWSAITETYLMDNLTKMTAKAETWTEKMDKEKTKQLAIMQDKAISEMMK